MTSTLLAPTTALDGRNALRAALRTASARLDASKSLEAFGPAHSMVPALLGVDHQMVTSHRFAASGWTYRDYEVVVVRRCVAPAAYAALLIVEPLGTQQSSDGEASNDPRRRHHSARRRSLKIALASAATADSLGDLFNKLQFRGSTWPTTNGVVLPNKTLSAPRLGACRAILELSEPEAAITRLLVALDGFTGAGRGHAGQLRLRLAQHLAFESTLRCETEIASTMHQWISTLSEISRAHMRTFWARAGVRAVAHAMASRDAMLTHPPITDNQWIQRQHVLGQVRDWLEAIGPVAH